MLLTKMCGILALLNTKQKDEMCDISLQKRGPDNKVVKNINNNTYFFNRLKIVDTEDTANQPFVKDDTVVMCNGEIYNHKLLEQEYGLNNLDSKSDCEKILSMYKKYKDFKKIVSLFDGVFAILLVDGDKVYFVRDGIGVRPLFYGKTDTGLAVSSIAKPLLNLVDKVIQVVPGMIYECNTNGSNMNMTEYKCNLPLMIPYPDDKVKSVRHILYDAVKKRIDVDRNIGCLLSGGLDSSIVASILCELMGPENVRTYSIGMVGSTDLHYANIMAKHLGTKHTEVYFTPDEGLDAIPSVIKELESYDITTIRASVPMYLLSKYIAENTSDRVIFSGEGADELFCGYLYFHNAPTPEDAAIESKRLVEDLHMYDVLRGDRCVSSNGLEFREPFLDRVLVAFALDYISADDKIPQTKVDGEVCYEKLLLRNAFSDMLPEQILWRRKEGFSDGNSSLDKPWSNYIGDYVNNIIRDDKVEDVYLSKEQMYYKQIFDKCFTPNYCPDIYMWMPKWSGDLKDPSGRLIKIFK